jgi:hypothetical protein
MNKVSVYGGLGNQMFQYALCLSLNQKKIKAKISISRFLLSFHHDGFLLYKAFKIKLGFPNNILNFILDKVEFLYKNRIAGFVFRRLIPFYHRFRYNTYKEKEEFVFDSNIYHQQNSYIEGIWQVELYFKDIRDVIAGEFVFREPEDSRNRDLIKRIRESDSISIHVRRGDYLDPYWEKILGVIKGTTYYHNAVDYIANKIENPVYFVFSDDVNWAKANLKLDNCVYVDHNIGKSSYIDMYLMSLCKHNIIANSTFSWWAAWLNSNKNRIVLMPERWIIGKSCEGIFPESWIKIKVN